MWYHVEEEEVRIEVRAEYSISLRNSKRLDQLFDETKIPGFLKPAAKKGMGMLERLQTAEQEYRSRLEKIVEGRVEKFFAESCLLEQQFIKDPERKVVDLLTEAVATLGENIIINRFTRYAIGESSDSSQSQ